MISGKDTDLSSSVDGHDGSRVSDIDDVDHVVDDHNDIGARTGSLRTDILPGHEVLCPSLSLFDQSEEVALTLSEALLDSFNWILGELLVLNNKVVQVVSQIIGTRGTTVSIEDSEETNLRPVDVKIGLVFGLQNVQDDRDAVFIVISDNTLVGIGSIGLDDSTLFLTGLGRLMILELNGARI